LKTEQKKLDHRFSFFIDGTSIDEGLGVSYDCLDSSLIARMSFDPSQDKRASNAYP